jgi:hypothetical protein
MAEQTQALFPGLTWQLQLPAVLAEPTATKHVRVCVDGQMVKAA